MPPMRAIWRRASGVSSSLCQGSCSTAHPSSGSRARQRVVRRCRRRKPDHRASGDRRLDRAPPAARRRANRVTCCARSGEARSSRKARCASRSGGLRRPPTWTRRPPPSARKSSACGAGRHARRHRRAGAAAARRRRARSLLARMLNPLARRYFLAPPGLPDSRRVARPGFATGGPAGRPTAPRFFSSCKSRRDCEKRPFQCVWMPPYSGRGRLVM